MIKKAQGRGVVLKVKRACEPGTADACPPGWSAEAELAGQLAEFRKLYEEALLRMRRAEQVGEGAPVPLFLLDAEGVVQWCNAAGKALLLTPGVDMVGTRLLVFVAPGSFTALRAHLLECLQGNGVSRTRVEVRRQDGSVRQLAVASRAVRMPGRQAPLVLLGAFDYTELCSREGQVRRQQQAFWQFFEQMLKSEAPLTRPELLQAALESALQLCDGDCAYWVWRQAGKTNLEAARWPGDRGRILADTVGARARQKGQRFLVGDYQVWPARVKITPFTSVRSAVAVLADLDAATPGELVVFSFAPGKTLAPNEVSELEKLVCLVRWADELLSARQATERLLERDKRLHRLLRIGTFCWHVKRRTVEWDEAFASVMGFAAFGAPSAAAGADLLRHVHPADLKKLQQAMLDWRDGRPTLAEARFIGADGSERCVQLTGELEEAADGPLVQGLGLDVTELRLAERARLAALRQEQGRLRVEQVMGLAVRLTDCLAQPVLHQMNLVQALLQRAAQGGAAEAVVGQLQALQAWTAQTDYQLRRLRSFAFYGAGTSLNLKKLDLAAVVGEWLAWQHDRLTAAGVVADVQGPSGLCAMLDRRRLWEALTELLDNALEHFAAAGTPAPCLTIHWSGDSRQIALQFQDNGPGFAEGVLLGGFQAFAATEGDGRLGLGLPLVRQIVQLHQGGVHVDNAPAGGARVSITLPETP